MSLIGYSDIQIQIQLANIDEADFIAHAQVHSELIKELEANPEEK